MGFYYESTQVCRLSFSLGLGFVSYTLLFRAKEEVPDVCDVCCGRRLPLSVFRSVRLLRHCSFLLSPLRIFSY